MRSKQTEHGTQLWLSAKDTRAWASRPGAAWPCSRSAGRRFWAFFDSKGDLVDMTVEGRSNHTVNDIPGDEFDAITSDFLREKYGPHHPAIRGGCTELRLAECLTCGLKWCDRCDPAPSALCHRCHGRGHSTAEVNHG